MIDQHTRDAHELHMQAVQILWKYWDREPLTLQIPAPVAYMVLAQLQLALRHPDNVGESTVVIRQFLTQGIERLGKIAPIIKQALLQGEHPEFDLSQQEFDALITDDETQA